MENLQKAVEELKSSPTVNIHGKNYSQVSTRINIFRKFFANAALETEITYNDDFRVIIKASISIDNQTIATGFAEEIRSNNDNSINSTSMIEVCETSAIGRALANFGLGGSEYASANEVGTAITQQENKQQPMNNYNHSYNTQNQAMQNNNYSTDFSELTKLNLSVMQQGQNWIVVGDNVFANKDLIKNKYGFKWDSGSRLWFRKIDQGAA